MNREQLDQRNTAAIRRHWRVLTDNGGTPAPALLEELATIADEHAYEILHEEVGVSGTPAPPKPTPARTAAKRTTTRRTTE